MFCQQYSLKISKQSHYFSYLLKFQSSSDYNLIHSIYIFTYLLLTPERSIAMIRTNPSNSKETLYFKNSVYQGNTKNHKVMNGSGFLYFFNDKNIIISQKFENNHLNGPSISIYGQTTYHYGSWKDNNPHGICYFRINDVLIISQYSEGTLINNNQIFLCLEKNNIGAIMSYSPDSGFKVKYKQQIYCHEHTLKLLEKGGFQTDKIVFSLLKFINSNFNSSDSSIKLRYVDDSRFRLAVQNGFSMYFNQMDEIQLIEIEEDVGTSQLSSRKTGIIYSTNDCGANLENQIVVDPSLKYFQQFKNSLNQSVIKIIVSGSIKDLSTSGNKIQKGINFNIKPIQIRAKEKRRKGIGTLSKIKHSFISKQTQNSQIPQTQYYYVNYLQKYPPRENLKEQISKIRLQFENINEEIKIVKLDQQTQTIVQNIQRQIQQIKPFTPQKVKTIEEQKVSSSTKKKIFDFSINRINRASDSSKNNQAKRVTQNSQPKAKIFKEDLSKQSSQYHWEYEEQSPKTPIYALEAQIKHFARIQSKGQQKQNKKLIQTPIKTSLPRKNSSSIEDQDMSNLKNFGQQQIEKKKNALPLKLQSKNQPYKTSYQQKRTHIHTIQTVRPKPEIQSQQKSHLLSYKRKQKNTKEQQSFKILIPHREGYPIAQQPSHRMKKQQRIRSYYLDLHAKNLKY